MLNSISVCCSFYCVGALTKALDNLAIIWLYSFDLRALTVSAACMNGRAMYYSQSTGARPVLRCCVRI